MTTQQRRPPKVGMELALIEFEATHEGRAVRSDALPEHIEYRDEGCDLFDSCLRCPLMRCRYDVPGGVRTLLNRERDHQIRMLRDDSALTVEEIAARFRVSRRTVFRALHLRQRNGLPETGCEEEGR